MRNPARALVLVAGVTTALTTAAPAFAESATDAGPGLTVSETLGIFVGIPALVIALVYGIVYAVTGRSQPRYRQGGGWNAQPQWWNGPVEPPSARGVTAGPEPAVERVAPPARASSGGGARAQW